MIIKLDTKTRRVNNMNLPAIACGEYYTIALDIDGFLYAWGQNSYSQLGNGSTAAVEVPIQIGTKKWSAIACWTSHTVALDTDGFLYAWGRNNYGQLGNGSTTTVKVPIQIGTKKWSAIACGAYHTIALDTDDCLYTWGNNATNQLGNGGTAAVEVPTKIMALGVQLVARFLFAQSNNLYTVKNGELVPLGSIVLEQMEMLFKENGLASVTSTECLVIAQTIKKARILKMSV